MATVFKKDEVTFDLKASIIDEFKWYSSSMTKAADPKSMSFDIRILEPGHYSYPYHSHRNSEELFVILSGEATLRTPKGFQVVKEGDIIFFEMGESGAHQMHNHSDSPCKFLDIRTILGLDVCDYPDSGKVNILPYKEIYEKDTQVDYFKNEKDVATKWKEKNT